MIDSGFGTWGTIGNAIGVVRLSRALHMLRHSLSAYKGTILSVEPGLYEAVSQGNYRYYR
jgi:hypothetical protein